MKEKEIERLTNLKKMEKELYQKGFQNICGIDEAGRGPLARTSSSCRRYHAERLYDRRSK